MESWPTETSCMRGDVEVDVCVVADGGVFTDDGVGWMLTLWPILAVGWMAAWGEMPMVGWVRWPWSLTRVCCQA